MVTGTSPWVSLSAAQQAPDEGGRRRGEHAELVPAEAVCAARAGHRLGQAAAEAGEQGVALRVAEVVVVALEAVEVEEQQPALGAGGERLGEVGEQAAAVGQAGERVVVGEVGELLSALRLAAARRQDGAPEHEGQDEPERPQRDLGAGVGLAQRLLGLLGLLGLDREQLALEGAVGWADAPLVHERGLGELAADHELKLRAQSRGVVAEALGDDLHRAVVGVDDAQGGERDVGAGQVGIQAIARLAVHLALGLRLPPAGGEVFGGGQQQGELELGLARHVRPIAQLEDGHAGQGGERADEDDDEDEAGRDEG